MIYHSIYSGLLHVLHKLLLCLHMKIRAFLVYLLFFFSFLESELTMAHGMFFHYCSNWPSGCTGAMEILICFLTSSPADELPVLWFSGGLERLWPL